MIYQEFSSCFAGFLLVGLSSLHVKSPGFGTWQTKLGPILAFGRLCSMYKT